MIGIYGIKIQDLPSGDTLRSALREGLLLPWTLRHGSVKNSAYLRASLGGLWLLQQAGFDGAVQYDSGGRPISLDPAWDFNVTHTDGWVFCAVEHLSEPCVRLPRIGLDAEPMGRFDDTRRRALVARWCAEGEREQYAAEPTDAFFTGLWTKKEAYAKYCGDGLCGLRRGDVTNCEGVCFFNFEVGDTVVTLCAHKDASPPLKITVVHFS